MEGAHLTLSVTLLRHVSTRKEKTMADSTLRALIDLRDIQIQKARIQFGNRLQALTLDEVDDGPEYQSDIIRKYYDQFLDLETKIDRDIAALVSGDQFCVLLTGLRGISSILAAKFTALWPNREPETVASLWRYCGYAVIDGKAERPRKGESLHYNKRMKKTCYLIGKSLCIHHPEYKQIYYAAKEYYTENRDWYKERIYLASLRRLIKTFLKHAWIANRHLKSLDVSDTSISELKTFGWPV